MAEEKKVPKTLDWVKARAECSIDTLFIMLDAVVKSDTEAADSRGGEYVEFRLRHVAENVFMVERKRNAGGILEGAVVTFERTSDGIRIYRQDARGQTPMFLVKPHVDIDGECKFERDGDPMEPWQVSKEALEAFFFEFGLSPRPARAGGS